MFFLVEICGCWRCDRYPGRNPEVLMPPHAGPQAIVDFLLKALCESGGVGAWSSDGQCTCKSTAAVETPHCL